MLPACSGPSPSQPVATAAQRGCECTKGPLFDKLDVITSCRILCMAVRLYEQDWIKLRLQEAAFDKIAREHRTALVEVERHGKINHRLRMSISRILQCFSNWNQSVESSEGIFGQMMGIAMLDDSLRFGKWSTLVRVSEADFSTMMNKLKSMRNDLNWRTERLDLAEKHLQQVTKQFDIERFALEALLRDFSACWTPCKVKAIYRVVNDILWRMIGRQENALTRAHGYYFLAQPCVLKYHLGSVSFLHTDASPDSVRLEVMRIRKFVTLTEVQRLLWRVKMCYTFDIKDSILQTDLEIFRAWIGTSEMVKDWLYDLTGDDVLGPVVSSILAFLGLRWVNDGTLNMAKV